MIDMALNESVFPALFGAQLAMWIIWIILIAFALMALYFVAWIWCLVDCAKRNRFRNGDRVMWILLLVLVPFISVILYYFMEARKD